MLHEMKRMQYDEFAYDWRQDLLITAADLGRWLNANHQFECDQHGNQAENQDVSLNIIAHSMGGLVAVLAMLKGHIHPKNVYQLICIGTPFRGAPDAFRAIYGPGHLPGMRWVNHFVNFRRDRRACRTALLNTFRTFPSIYQLLPPDSDAFVRLRDDGRIHPLKEGSPVPIPPIAYAAARDAHDLLANLEPFLNQYSVPYHFIYSSAARSSQDTPDHFDASVTSSMGSLVYSGVRIRSYVDGDGTVPVDSASCQDRHGSNRLYIPGVPHIAMCNNRNVVEVVKNLLPWGVTGRPREAGG